MYRIGLVILALLINLPLVSVNALTQSEIEQGAQYAYDNCINKVPGNYTDFQKQVYLYGCEAFRNAILSYGK